MEEQIKNKKYKRTISILCVLLIISCFSITFLASNSLSLDTNKIPNQATNINSNEMKKAIEFLTQIEKYLRTINTKENIDILKVDIASKIYELTNNDYDSAAVDAVAVELLETLSGSYKDGESLISSLGLKLSDTIKNLIPKLDTLVLNYDKRIQIDSITASQPSEAGSSYKAELNGYIYYAKEKSTKWVVLVHPYMTNGKIMASAVGKMYLDQGYNIIAPDLRGFGKSGGSVAMGYLESLDIWDWLTYINDANNPGIGEKAATEVIIHGTSLGGATTLQTWTQTTMGRDLTTKNVVGIVDDCGYDSMTGIIKGMLTTGAGMELLTKIANLANQEDLYSIVGEDNVKKLLLDVIKVGIKENEFDLKQNAFHPSRKMSKVPLFIIHGTSDTMVPYTISTSIVYPAAKRSNLLYDFWQVSGQQHAFIIVGMERTAYENNINKFIKYVSDNNIAIEEEPVIKPPIQEETSKEIEDVESKKQDSKEENVLSKISNAIGEFFKSVINFFKNLFK